MKYFHCPEVFRRKPYGCGFGPVNFSKAWLDLNFTCPQCGNNLKEVRRTSRKHMAAIQERLDAAAAADELFGTGTSFRYLASHRKLSR